MFAWPSMSGKWAQTISSTLCAIPWDTDSIHLQGITALLLACLFRCHFCAVGGFQQAVGSPVIQLGCTFRESTNRDLPNLFNFVRVLSDVFFPLFSLCFFPKNSAKCLEQSSMFFHVLKREKLKTAVIKMKERCITKPYNNSGSGTLLRPQIQREFTKYRCCLQPCNLAWWNFNNTRTSKKYTQLNGKYVNTRK